MRSIIVMVACLAVLAFVGISKAASVNSGGGKITVKEADGSPDVTAVSGITVTNGSLTDNGDGTVTVATSGATGVALGSSTVTGGTTGGALYVAAGPVMQQLTGAGLMLVNSGSAPTIYGGTTCTNQVVRLLSAAGAATCVTLTSAYVDTSIWTGTVSSGLLKASSQGVVAQAAAGTDYTVSIAGTSNQIDLSGSSGVRTAALSSTLVIPGPGIEFTETAGDSTCAAGNYWIKANSTTSNFRKCQNGTATDLDTGGAGGIGGSSGAVDNAILRADGTGGSTIQSSGCTIDDSAVLTCSGGFAGSGAGTGVLVLAEGTAPSAPAVAGDTNVFFDSADHKLKSQVNGGSVLSYVRTADNLSALAATTSDQLATVLSDEIGTAGGFVRGTGSTLTNLTVAGTAIVFPDGVTQTFNPNGTNSGLNVGTQAGDPASPANGDIWYSTATNSLRCRQNGVTSDCVSTGAGTGDVTDVNAGAGIAVATPGGPAPTVSWDASTFVNNVTMWNAANASRTWTANLSGATDPVITFSDGSMDLTTGTLKQGGVSVSTASSTDTFTNKTLDAEGTGNVITIPRRIWLPAAGCNNATAGSIWDLPTSAPAVAACVTGTNTQKGVLDFADGSNLSAQISWKLPSTWTGNIDANIKWFTTAITGDVVWQIATICVADAETDDPAFNTASTVTDTAKGTTNQTNDAAITSVTVTGCAAGELMHVKIFRDSGNVSDTLAATARLIGVELVVREAL